MAGSLDDHMRWATPTSPSLTILCEIKAANETLTGRISAWSTSVEVETEDSGFTVIIQSGERTWCHVRDVLSLHLGPLNFDN